MNLQRIYQLIDSMHSLLYMCCILRNQAEHLIDVVNATDINANHTQNTTCG